jgi:hypothetical protein
MQMKKNYLLLFLIALLFGTATMRGQRSYPLDDQVEYYFKLGKGYMIMHKKGLFKCVPQKSDAGIMKIGTNGTNTTFPIGGLLDGAFTSLKYLNGKLMPIGSKKQQFEYLTIGNKHYLKSTEDGANNGYLTNKNGTITFESAPSEDAVFEFENKDGGNATEIAEKAKKMLNRLSFFQAYRYGLGDKFESSPFMGSGLGQYPLPVLPDANHAIKDKWEYFSYKMYRNSFAGLKGDKETTTAISVIETCEKALHINTPQAGTYVVISTKSQYEDKIRLNDNRSSELNFTPGSAAGPSQPAKYLQATATGYQLTTTKAEASVFYFDGNHLTGLDNGFGLNTTQNKYDLTEDAQKAVVKQGKLEKTLDAGSYSLKVGDKFVKLDNTGLSVTDNESESHIFLEEATEFKLNTDALGYVSFFAPTAVEILDNVEVYTGKLNAQNSVVNLKKVNTKKIPEKTAVLLRKGTSKTSFTVKKIDSAPAITDNSLKGYTVSSNKNVANAYGFAVQNGKLVFVPIADGVRAFKAVIFNGNAAGMQEFIPTAFVPTGIEGVTAEENKEEIFDLTGRRVESPVKGQVYVKGGKKFIQK